jgi:flagellar biosynthesis/type III secretory pathway M-ring protein FliF/YscJ
MAETTQAEWIGSSNTLVIGEGYYTQGNTIQPIPICKEVRPMFNADQVTLLVFIVMALATIFFTIWRAFRNAEFNKEQDNMRQAASWEDDAEKQKENNRHGEEVEKEDNRNLEKMAEMGYEQIPMPGTTDYWWQKNK